MYNGRNQESKQRYLIKGNGLNKAAPCLKRQKGYEEKAILCMLISVKITILMMKYVYTYNAQKKCYNI